MHTKKYFFEVHNNIFIYLKTCRWHPANQRGCVRYHGFLTWYCTFSQEILINFIIAQRTCIQKWFFSAISFTNSSNLQQQITTKHHPPPPGILLLLKNRKTGNFYSVSYFMNCFMKQLQLLFPFSLFPSPSSLHLFFKIWSVCVCIHKLIYIYTHLSLSIFLVIC